MYAADLPAVPAATRKAWTEFVKDNLPGRRRRPRPLERRGDPRGGRKHHRDQRTLPGAGARRPARRLAAVGPRPAVHRPRGRHRAARTGARPPPRPARRPGPEIRRNPPRGDDRFFPVRERDAPFRRRGGRTGARPPASHQVAGAPVKTVHDRKLNWILVTHYKYMTRKAAGAALTDYALRGRPPRARPPLPQPSLRGETPQEKPGPLARAHYYSVIARFGRKTRTARPGSRGPKPSRPPGSRSRPKSGRG